MENVEYKRFLVFSFEDYYPCGGIGDIEGTSDDIEEAIRIANEDTGDYVYVFDCDLRKVVYEKK